MVIASIGPTTSETLRDNDLAVDVEPEHSKMGHLVAAAAAEGPDLSHGRKQRVTALATARGTSMPANRHVARG